MIDSSVAFQAHVAQIALHVASRYGFALAGGHALIAHGVVDRPTTDIDLFTDQQSGVKAAAGPVVAALHDAGLTVEPVTRDAPLFYGFDDDLIEYNVRDGRYAVRVQLVHFGRNRKPVVMAIGPVLHLDDVVGTKVAALLTRAEPRDLIDVAALQSQYSHDDLVRLGRVADPDLTDDEFAEAMDRLDQTRDRRLAVYGLSPDEIEALRAGFADWPRTDHP